MKNFTQIVESRRTMSPSAVKIMQNEIAEYNKKMSRKIPEEVSLVTSLLNKYSVYDADMVRDILKASKSELGRISDELSIDYKDAEQIQFLLKKIDKAGNLRLIPMMMSKNEREDLETGRKALDDITMDLETDKGRTAVARAYSSLVMSIVSKFTGKSGLDQEDLMGAGMEGLVKAMNSYRKPGTSEIDDLDIDDSDKKEGAKVKGLTFKQYAGWCIRNSILSEINKNSRTVRINHYQYSKMKDSGDISRSFIKSIDQMGSGDSDEGTGSTDRIPDLGEDPEVFKHDHTKDDERYKELYKIIDSKFSLKEASIFYKIFGVNGFTQATARTIGAEMGLSEFRVSQIKSKIITYLRSLKNDPKAAELLSMLRDIYTESLVARLYSLPKNQIAEALISDDTYILLETVTKWDSKERLSSAVSSTLESMDPDDADYIVKCLRDGFDFVDSTYRGRKQTIVSFLSTVEPTESFYRRSDAYILDKMTELSDMCKKYKLYQK